MNSVAEKVRIVAGMMLMGTWGHEQTNASFYKVLRVSGGFATLQEYNTARKDEPGGFMCGTTMPTDVPNGAPIRRKIHAPEWSGVEFVRPESYMTARPWDGVPVRTSWYA